MKRKNYWKKAASLLFATVVGLGTITGCGTTEETVLSGSTDESDVETDLSSEDVTTLSVVMCSVGDKTGTDEVIEQINEISREEINVEIEVEWIEIGNWVEQMNLKMSGAEDMDIIMGTPLMTISSMLTSNELMDLSGYLEEYGQDILEILPAEYIESASDETGTYAIPMVMTKQDSVYIAMRTDVLEELGLTEQAEEIDSWSDLEEVLEIVKNNTDYVPLYCASQQNTGVTIPDYVDLSADDWTEAGGIDNLGDSYGLIYVDEETNTVCSYYQSDIFKADMQRAADYYEKGYLYADGATTDMEASTAMGSDVCFAAMFGTADLGAETNTEANTGIDVTMVKIASETITSHLINMWSFAVPYTASDPEAAVAFLNLMYSNEEVANLFCWGIEGRDYTLNEDGTATALDDATYSSQYWLSGNSLIIYPNETDGAEFQDDSEEVIANQNYSDYLGFMCDTTEVSTELSACYTVMQEYAYTLLAGCVSDYEQEYEAFITKLEDSGIDTIVECYQTQLDAWLAEQ